MDLGASLGFRLEIPIGSPTMTIEVLFKYESPRDRKTGRHSDKKYLITGKFAGIQTDN